MPLSFYLARPSRAQKFKVKGWVSERGISRSLRVIKEIFHLQSYPNPLQTCHSHPSTLNAIQIFEIIFELWEKKKKKNISMKEVAFIEDALVAIFRFNSLPSHRRLTFDVKDSKKEKEIFSYLCYQLFFPHGDVN